MRLNISGLNELRERLERLHPDEVMAQALAEQAALMAARVRDGLSEPPGVTGHDEPWLQSGALRDSVGAQADGLQALVGSNDPAAVPQEMGTGRMPARPFLAPVAASMGEDVARAVGARMAAALRGDSTDGFDSSSVQFVSGSGKHPMDPGDIPPQDQRAVEEGLETPGQARSHGLPQIIPGLDSPSLAIPHLGGGPMSAAPRSVVPGGQASGSAAPMRQPPAANRAQFQNCMDNLRRNMGRPATTDPKLSGIMDEMYRTNAKVGSGNTADVARSERATGQPTGGAWHTQKAEESVIRLQRWLQANPMASPGDRAAAENVIHDLQNALVGE